MTGKRSTAYRKGDVVLVPFPFTNQRTRKVRPAVVLSSDAYHVTEPDLILGALTTNLTAATAPVDYVLAEWQRANLRYPSAFKPLLFSLEPSLIVHTVGSLSAVDMAAVNDCIRRSLALPAVSLSDPSGDFDLAEAPISLVQRLAEQSIAAIVAGMPSERHAVALEHLRLLLDSALDQAA